MNEEKYVVPTATLTERPDDYVLGFEIPGVGKGEADLHCEGRTLTLKTHAKYQNPAGFKEALSEFERANYAISVDLPEMADLASIKAELENGILRVTVQKRAETKARKIEIG